MMAVVVDERTWSFEATLWRWRDGSWHFVTVPAQVSDEVDEAVGDATGGFGSVRVRVRVGGTTWLTSLFPSAEQAAYVLPVKKAVRAAEGLAEGGAVRVVLTLAG
ncbi:hypothetical protein PDTK01_29860 [Phycicoccus sp. DTK01]|nr:hypothetical protein PDTK01_29860 [Phycicoccus sp. DTK01]